MSEREMVYTFIASGRVKRFEGYTGTPKGTKQIVLNAKSEKRRGNSMSGRRLENFGKYIERNF